ncbi:Inner membrane metabolite transport protein YhjE [Pseudoclavibacter triregionum]|nr:Inner membrane metabolite transport protein YhjE [Pseudoclavibacter triregionum]
MSADTGRVPAAASAHEAGAAALSPDEQLRRMPASQKLRILAGSLVGSTIEWFEFFLYASAASIVFSKQFFPSDNEFISIMLSYLTLALTFFVRPFGGAVFAHLGDRIGRKRTLVVTLLLMGIATMGIGLLPNYAAIGMAAPILLILLRLVQGLAISGEWGGAVLLAYEYAPRERRGLFGSIPQVGISLGMLLATATMALLSFMDPEAFAAWGWRIPFVGSILLILLGLWIRGGVDETPAFRKVQEQGRQAKLPILEVFRKHWRAVLVVIGAKAVETAPFYIVATFILSYATSQAVGFDKPTVLTAVSVAALVTSICIPFAGALSDRFGRMAVFVTGAVLMAAFAFPYFLMVNAHEAGLLFAASIIALGLIWPLITGTYSTLASEIFSADVRYTGITLGYQVGAALVGGTAPLIATGLMEAFHGSWVPVAVFIIAMAVISIVSILLARSIARHETELDLAEAPDAPTS